MFRKRNLAALLMAATLSIGSIGVCFAGDDGSDYVPTPHQTDRLNGDDGSDFAPVPHTIDQQTDLSSVWA
jgi:hypothetical protein